MIGPDTGTTQKAVVLLHQSFQRKIKKCLEHSFLIKSAREMSFMRTIEIVILPKATLVLLFILSWFKADKTDELRGCAVMEALDFSKGVGGRACVHVPMEAAPVF